VTVAYVVFSHRAPDQVLRLLHTLRAGSPAARLISHHDGSLEVPPGVEQVFPPTHVTWGGPKQLEMLLRGLRHALAGEFDWLVLLSGQDYPLRTLERIERDSSTAGSTATFAAERLRRQRDGPGRGSRGQAARRGRRGSADPVEDRYAGLRPGGDRWCGGHSRPDRRAAGRALGDAAVRGRAGLARGACAIADAGFVPAALTSVGRAELRALEFDGLFVRR
jgi:hypothetical protein